MSVYFLSYLFFLSSNVLKSVYLYTHKTLIKCISYILSIKRKPLSHKDRFSPDPPPPNPSGSRICLTVSMAVRHFCTQKKTNGRKTVLKKRRIRWARRWRLYGANKTVSVETGRTRRTCTMDQRLVARGSLYLPVFLCGSSGPVTQPDCQKLEGKGNKVAAPHQTLSGKALTMWGPPSRVLLKICSAPVTQNSTWPNLLCTNAFTIKTHKSTKHATRPWKLSPDLALDRSCSISCTLQQFLEPALL